MATPAQRNPEQIVRLSFGWLLSAIVGVLLVGLLGGWLATQVMHPTLPPLTNDRNNLVTTVQQVTISPNKAVAQTVAATERSVLLIAKNDGATPIVLGTGFVLTNDGVVVTSVSLPTGTYVAFDHEGQQIPLSLMGRDEVFGLTYLQISDAVVAPLDIQLSDSTVGQDLLLLSRNRTTYGPRMFSWRVNEYEIPTGAPAGWQRVARGTSIDDTQLAGSPLLDDEGKVAAILTNPGSGQALPVSLLQTSLQRATSQQREVNPVSDVGVTLQYVFTTAGPTKDLRFGVRVQSVTSNSPAAQAGLKAGDIITSFGDTPLTWEQSVVTQLATHPQTFTIVRDTTEQTLTIVAAPAPSPSPAR